GSLRYEIAVATSKDTIVFDHHLNGQTITLTTGELVISKTLTIKGPGPYQLMITSQPYVNGLFETFNGSPVFHGDGAHTTVTISGLTMANGGGTRYGGGLSNQPYDGYGGAVLNFGTLTISGCFLGTNVISSGNDAQYGGAIANFGTLGLTSCYVQN